MKNRRKMVLAAFFLALALVVPSLTGRITEMGSMFLPMHIPVIVCGFVCGWKYGMLVGFLAPLMNCFLGGPTIDRAVRMAFELATYGAMTGIFYEKFKRTKFGIYASLFLAMIAGRLVWGVASVLILGMQGQTFGWSLFMGGALLNAIPGIVLQIIFVPVLIMVLEKTGAMRIDEYVV